MTAAQAAAPAGNARARELFKKYQIVLILVIIVGVLAAMTGGKFLQLQNLINVIRQVSVIAILGIGLTVVIISTGIDLSVGSILAVSAVVSASLVQEPTAAVIMYPGLDLPVWVGILAGLAVGALLGLINGILVAGFRIAPFIATLGMMTSARGLALIYAGGRPVSKLDPVFNEIGQGDIFGVPIPIVLLILVAVVAQVVLSSTRFGRYVYAIGGNEQAARVSGINLGLVKVGIYALSGLLAGLGGMILTARIGSGNPQLGTGIELDAITASIIGGTSFAGGIGTVWGAIVGAMIIGSINTGLDLLNVSPFAQMVVKGLIIIIAIIIDERKNR